MKNFKYRKLTELKLLHNNPRKIGKPEFEILCKSIKENPEFFEARPILLSDRTGELVIIAGNQRYKAAQHLKLKLVPTVLLKGLTEAKEKELVIRDNISLGEFDFEILELEFSELPFEEFGLDVKFGDATKDLSDKIKSKFIVEISCKNEKEQEKLYNEMIKKKYECRLLTL